MLILTKPTSQASSCPSDWSIKIAKYTIAEGEVIPLLFEINNHNNSFACKFEITIIAPHFDIDPNDTTIEITISPKSIFKEILWFVTPKVLGQLYIVVDLKLPSNTPSITGKNDMTSLLDEKGYAFEVNNIFGFNILQNALLTIIWVVIGSAIFIALLPSLLSLIGSVSKKK